MLAGTRRRASAAVRSGGEEDGGEEEEETGVPSLGEGAGHEEPLAGPPIGDDARLSSLSSCAAVAAPRLSSGMAALKNATSISADAHARLSALPPSLNLHRTHSQPHALTLIIPHLPIDIGAPAADMRKIEHDAVPSRLDAQALDAVEARGVDGKGDGVPGGAQGGDARGGVRVLGGERGGGGVEAGGVDVRGPVVRGQEGQRGGEGEVACVCVYNAAIRFVVLLLVRERRGTCLRR